MTSASVGSVSFLPSQGRMGVVVGAQRVGAPEGGRQLMLVQIKAVGPSKCEEGADCGPRTAGPGADLPRGADSIGAGAALAAQGPQVASGSRDRDGSAGDNGLRAGARGYEELSSEERAVVDRLRQRDAQVKQEEKAHAAVAGDLAGPISYSYQRGPDGRLYAVGGSVPIQAQSFIANSDEAARVGARLAAAGHAATNPSGADLAAVRAGYRLQGNDQQGPGPSEPKGEARRELDITV